MAKQATGVSADERLQLGKLLGDRASYVVLKDESKEPVGRYRQKMGSTPRARREAIPLQGNYGIIPQRGWFILDLDVHKASLHKQLAIFEQLFGVDFDEAIQVETPSGGYHLYLRLPENFNEPIFNGSLRPYAKQLLEASGLPPAVIDADIRSSEATGYVVGPGSHVSLGKAGTAYETPGGYVLRGNSKHLLSHGEFKGLAEISLGGAELLRHLRQLQLQKRTPKQSEITESRPQAQEPLLEEAPSDEVLARVSRGLQRRQLRSAEYHRQRAFVLAALRCCYSDYSIAVACVKLDIDRDSYTKDRLPFWETLADMKKLRVATKVTHGSYCERGVARRPRGEQALEVNLKRLNERVKRRAPESTRTFRQPRVLNMGKIIRLLDRGTPKTPQRVKDAVLILDTLFQPLCNIGANRMVVARAPIAEALGISPSRLADAMRLLREREIIHIKNRQVTGLAATYDVNEAFLDKYLTGSLKYRWSLVKQRENRSAILLYNRFDNSFHELGTEKTYRIDGTVKRDWRLELGIPPLVELELLAKRYLSNSF